ncbi:HNH endonuclease [Leisingera daeponensis]|uniref:HNH endonuclease n=1 Tax=Leisingera daeponensis TaxID=405746 RepID=UPI001C93D4A9|nr:EVE domain-containing protein [Leisingera daeponensis]
MSTWIFEFHTDHFNFDDLLDGGTQQFDVLVEGGDIKIRSDDQIFVWRTKGQPGADPGIVAECSLLDAGGDPADDNSGLTQALPPIQSDSPSYRVRLEVKRVANKKKILKESWLKEDPVARDLQTFKSGGLASYRVSEDIAARLSRLWQATGVDWDRADCVAGLWVYKEVYGGEVSKRPNRPVSNVALLTGRAVTGVYNRVMNYRHLDPRDKRKGFSGAGDVAKAVWAEFFSQEDENLDDEAIEQEFRRLWGDGKVFLNTASAANEALHRLRQAERLASLKLEELEARLAMRSQRHMKRNELPTCKAASTRVFDRDPLIVAIRRVRAGHRCEVPDCSHPEFLDSKGLTYCEVHHIVPLAEGGPDTLENLVCLCPAHHVEAHRGKEKDALRDLFFSLRRTKHP